MDQSENLGKLDHAAQVFLANPCPNSKASWVARVGTWDRTRIQGSPALCCGASSSSRMTRRLLPRFVGIDDWAWRKDAGSRIAACGGTSRSDWLRPRSRRRVSTRPNHHRPRRCRRRGSCPSSGSVGVNTERKSRRPDSMRSAAECADLSAALDLADEFAALIRKVSQGTLTAWLARAESSSCPEIRRFAEGIRRDEAAVQAAVSGRWSNGPVEGHVNRLKMIKRQMYGRAGFVLLRARVVKVA